MQELAVRVYEDKKSFFGKFTNSILKMFTNTNYNTIDSNMIDKKRKNVVKSYTKYLNNKKNIDMFEYTYTLYLESIDNYIMNKVYDRVKNKNGTEYEKELLAKYYEILKIKENEYYEYKYRKQLYLLKEDFSSAKINNKVSREYKTMYYDCIDNTYKKIFKYYNEKWNENKEEKYLNKILDLLEEFFKDCFKKYSIDNNVNEYLIMSKETKTQKEDLKPKTILQIELIKKYLQNEISEDLINKIGKKVIRKSKKKSLKCKKYIKIKKENNNENEI